MHQVYLPQDNFNDSFIKLCNKDEIHHLKNVLRKKKDDIVVLINGKGSKAEAIIDKITAKEVILKVQNNTKQKPNSPRIILACAPPKKTKFEWIIEKCCELGVHSIIPLLTERTEITFKNRESQNKKADRWRSVAINAMKQSQQTFLPEMYNPTPFTEIFTDPFTDIHWNILSLQESSMPIVSALSNTDQSQSVGFLIGPEGDFTDKEYALAKKNKAQALTLGKNVLKVETAAICAVSYAVQYFHVTKSS